jgi:hypothetical protein
MSEELKPTKVKVNAYIDRQRVVEGLVNSGYRVWIEEVPVKSMTTDYYVCWGDK